MLGETCTNVGECYLNFNLDAVMCMNGKCTCNWGFMKQNNSVCLKDKRSTHFLNGESALTRVLVDRQISPHFISAQSNSKDTLQQGIFFPRAQARARAHKALLCGAIMCLQLRAAKSHARPRVMLQFLRLQAIRYTYNDAIHLGKTSRTCSWKAVPCRTLRHVSTI